jgi:hypothetical protein
MRGEPFMNVKYLALHATAFSMYLVGVLFYYTLQTWYFIKPEAKFVFGLYNITSII